MDEVDTAIQNYRQLIQETSENDEARPAGLLLLCISLLERFAKLGSLSDLDEAVDSGREAVNIMPEESPQFSFALRHGMMAVGERFLRFKRLHDAESFTDLALKALTALDGEETVEQKPTELIGGGFLAKYMATGQVEDLEACIWCF